MTGTTIIDTSTIVNFTIAVAIGRFVSDIAFYHYRSWREDDTE